VDVVLDEPELAVRDVARDVLAGLVTPALVREIETDPIGYSPKLWRAVAELDWLGLCLPESVGGQGYPLHYAGLLLEEAGRTLAPIPLHATLTAALVLARHAEDRAAELLAAVVAGETILAVAVQEGRTLYADGVRTPVPRTRARREGTGFVLTGEKRFVDHAGAADTLLVPATLEDGVALFLVERGAPGVSATPLVTLAKDQQSHLRFDDVPLAASALVVEPENGAAALADLLDVATALLTAQLAGATRRDAEFAVEHSKNRVAFGRPIGAFQSLQHLAADMLIAVDGVDLLNREALWLLGSDQPAAVEVSQAKAFAGDKCVFVARSAQQIHGGIGFMMEFDLHLWYRRIVAWSLRYGTVAEHRARVAAALLDTPGPVRLGFPQHLPSRSLT
jgi:alkylation response protein AidB-like acyl-CoA dehydrogenase